MTRRGWAIAILSVWILALGWLAHRQFFQSTGERLAQAALAVPPGAVFYRLEIGGQQVGFASSTIDTLRDSVRVEDHLVIDVPALGRLHRTTARSIATVNRALHLLHVDATYDAGAGSRYSAHGTIVGDSSLSITLVSGKDTETTRLRLARPIVLPSLLALRLAFGGELRPGNTYALRLFDPLLLAERDVAVTVAAETTLVVADSADYDSTAMAWVPVHFDTVPAFRIDQRSGGLRLRTWIDAQGHVVRATSPAGFALQRSAFEIAYDNFRHRDTARLAQATATSRAGEIIAATAIAAGVGPELSPPAELRLRIGGIAFPPQSVGEKSEAREAGLDLGGGRQLLSGDTLVVRREGPAPLVARYHLPAIDTALTPFLGPEPLIQTMNPRIDALAHLIAGPEHDPAVVAALLTHWVAREIQATATAGMPSALDVLASRRGDCNEHTALYLALARALGLPARSAAGLLYTNGRFYYHAWPEVYLGDWVAVDPTFDQIPADAAHVRVAIGSFARQAELARLLGKLTLEAL